MLQNKTNVISISNIKLIRRTLQ